MENTDFQNLIISKEEAEQFAKDHFGINCTAKALPGEVDFNFYLRSKKGSEYTLKISRPGVDFEELDFQAKILEHLSKQELPFQIPVPFLNPDGKAIIAIEDQNQQARWLRLQKWVPGRVLAKVNPRSSSLLRNWGNTCGKMSEVLKSFDHPFAHRFYKWTPSETLFSKKFRAYISNKDQLEIVDYFWALFEEDVLPKLPQLRKSVNYNDAHEHNLLVNADLKNPVISGVIDFGDALYTETVNELAIASAYACMDCPDPLEAAVEVIRGYHEIFPLQEIELEVLFPLIAARLLITVSNAAWNKHREPENEYLTVSEAPAWEVLKKLRNISPNLAHFTFRDACGLAPCPMSKPFQDWIYNQETDFAPLMGFDFNQTKICQLDLSVSSLDLGNNSEFDTIAGFENKIRQLLAGEGAELGIGGYGEIRPFYSTDAYQVQGNNGPKWRTCHLGLDIWMEAGSPIYAPLEGIVHSFQNNEGDCNYGPTIILKHKVEEELTFYTLYGHLNLSSLIDLKEGMVIEKGQQIAELGPPQENGNWPPHLHFQVILNMLGKKGDFPGVAFPQQQRLWQSICPDPNLLLKIENSEKQAELSNQEMIEARQEKLGKNLSLSYQKPLHIVRGYNQYLFNHQAQRYLDTVNNVPHIGHQHPRVVKAAQRQIALLNTNTRYLHENIIRFSEELLTTFPSELSVCFIVNSGSEANELALRMVKNYTRQKDMIAVEVGYHGNTGGCIDISSYKFDGKGGKGAPNHTHVVPIPDTYRGIYQSDDAMAGLKYAAHVEQAIKKIEQAERGIAGFICESILSCGGQVVLPDGYLQEAYQQVRKAGGLCIADEVQVGFGRVGEHFWGFELQGVVPDIVTMGKPIGNGHPLAALVTTKAVADSFANGMEYFNTFGGNPVSCAIGREVLQVIKDEKLQEHAQKIGKYLLDDLKTLQKDHPIIGDVRGKGLFLGLELVSNRKTKSPASEQASWLINRMREHNILMSTDGPFNNVVKIKPPMCFTKANAGLLLNTLDKVLKEDYFLIQS